MKRLIMAIFSLITINTATTHAHSFFKPYTVKQYAQVFVPLSLYSITSFKRYQPYLQTMIRPSTRTLVSKFTMFRPQFNVSTSLSNFFSFTSSSQQSVVDNYTQEDIKMCQLFDELADPNNQKHFSEIKQELTQLNNIKEHHPELMNILLTKSGYELFQNLRRMPHTNIPPRFAEKKKKIIENPSIIQLTLLFGKITNKFF